MGRASTGLMGVPLTWGEGLETDDLSSSLKLAQFVQQHDPWEVPAPSWDKHQVPGRFHERVSCPGGFRWVLMEGAETGVSSWRHFPLSLQDSLSAGPGKGMTVLQEGK